MFGLPAIQIIKLLPAFLISSASAVLSIYFEQPLFVLLPFVFLLVPLIYNRPHLLFFILISLLPLSTEFQFNESLGTDLPDEFLMIILTAFFILLVVYKPDAVPSDIYRHPLFLLVVLHICWIVICTFFSYDPVLSVKYLLAKLWYVIPFVLLTCMFV